MKHRAKRKKHKLTAQIRTEQLADIEKQITACQKKNNDCMNNF